MLYLRPLFVLLLVSLIIFLSVCNDSDHEDYKYYSNNSKRSNQCYPQSFVSSFHIFFILLCCFRGCYQENAPFVQIIDEGMEYEGYFTTIKDIRNAIWEVWIEKGSQRCDRANNPPYYIDEHKYQSKRNRYYGEEHGQVTPLDQFINFKDQWASINQKKATEDSC